MSATFQPSPTAPSRSVSGIRTSVKKTSLNEAPPLICRIGRTSTPGASIGTRKAVSPACLATDESVRQISSPHAENRAPELHTFCPLTTHSSPSRTARVPSPARSEPAPGSENSWQHSTSVRRNGRMNRACCCSVPKRAIVGATSRSVTLKVSWLGGTSKAASSSRKASRCSTPQAGAAELDRPRDRAVAGVELAPLPRHQPLEQVALVGRRSRSWNTETSSDPLPHAGPDRPARGGVLLQPGRGLRAEHLNIHNHHDVSVGKVLSTPGRAHPRVRASR